MDTLADLRRTHGASVLFIYLSEAHAIDTWPLSSDAPRSHANLDNRRDAATRFLSRWPQFAREVQFSFVDGMNDENTIAKGLWPERYLVIRDGVVTWASALTEEPIGDMWRAATRWFQ